MSSHKHKETQLLDTKNIIDEMRGEIDTWIGGYLHSVLPSITKDIEVQLNKKYELLAAQTKSQYQEQIDKTNAEHKKLLDDTNNLHEKEMTNQTSSLKGFTLVQSMSKQITDLRNDLEMANIRIKSLQKQLSNKTPTEADTTKQSTIVNVIKPNNPEWQTKNIFVDNKLPHILPSTIPSSQTSSLPCTISLLKPLPSATISLSGDDLIPLATLLEMKEQKNASIDNKQVIDQTIPSTLHKITKKVIALKNNKIETIISKVDDPLSKLNINTIHEPAKLVDVLSVPIIETVHESSKLPELIKVTEQLPEPVKVNEQLPEPVKVTEQEPIKVAEPEPVKVAKKLPEPVKIAKKLQESVKVDEQVPEPVKIAEQVPEQVKVIDPLLGPLLPQPLESTKALPEQIKVVEPLQSVSKKVTVYKKIKISGETFLLDTNVDINGDNLIYECLNNKPGNCIWKKTSDGKYKKV